MANFKALKKIAALVTAIALVVCFAVSASAINVVTKTTYVENDKSLVTVDVTVTGLDAGDTYVTYYATDDEGEPVHIDQAAKTGSSATFNFCTELDNLNSSVLIGRTSADATEKEITGRTITWSVDGSNEGSGADVIPTEAENIQIPYKESSGKTFGHATLNGEEAAAVFANGNITVTLTDFEEGQNDGIVIYETEIPANAPAAAVQAIDGGIITVANEEEFAAAGNRKLTVIGKVTGYPVGNEYGIIVSDEALAEGTMAAADFAKLDKTFAARTAISQSPNGLFAIQLIDTSDAESENAFVKAGMNVAVYAKTSADTYTISNVTLNE